MTESLSNIGLVCPECASQPGKYTGQPPAIFLGKHVKLGFKTEDGEKTEHMWVKVTALDPNGKELHGILDNDPIYDVGYDCGDLLAFAVDEIEDVT